MRICIYHRVKSSCYFVSNEVFATPLTFLFDWYFTFHSIAFFEFINSSIISLMAYQGVSESCNVLHSSITLPTIRATLFPCGTREVRK